MVSERPALGQDIRMGSLTEFYLSEANVQVEGGWQAMTSPKLEPGEVEVSLDRDSTIVQAISVSP